MGLVLTTYEMVVPVLAFDAQAVGGAVIAVLFATGGVLMTIGLLRMIDPTLAKTFGQSVRFSSEGKRWSARRTFLYGVGLVGGTWLLGMAYLAVDALL